MNSEKMEKADEYCFLSKDVFKACKSYQAALDLYKKAEGSPRIVCMKNNKNLHAVNVSIGNFFSSAGKENMFSIKERALENGCVLIF